MRQRDGELTHLVGGVAIRLAGDMPADDAARGEGSASIALRLQTHVAPAPLRPAGTPVIEVDSWAAFVDEHQFTLCIKDASATPPEVMRVELPRAGLEGHAYYRDDAAPRPFAYPSDQLLTIHALGVGGGLLAHAASIVGRDGAFLVAGPSGAGKSTMSRACSELGARILSDERTVVRPVRSDGATHGNGATHRDGAPHGSNVTHGDGAAHCEGDGATHSNGNGATHGDGAAHGDAEPRAAGGDARPAAGAWALGGTPWPGEGGFAHNSSAPLRGLVFLEQADRDELVPITPARALALLYRCHFPPVWDDQASARVLDHLARLVQDVPAFVFHNRKGPAAARLLLDRLGGPLQ